MIVTEVPPDVKPVVGPIPVIVGVTENPYAVPCELLLPITAAGAPATKVSPLGEWPPPACRRPRHDLRRP